MSTLRVDTILPRHSGGRINIPGGVASPDNLLDISTFDIQSGISIERTTATAAAVAGAVVFAKVCKFGPLVHLTTRGFSFESPVDTEAEACLLATVLPAPFRPYSWAIPDTTDVSFALIDGVTNSFRGVVGEWTDGTFSDMAVTIASTGAIRFHIAGGFDSLAVYTIPSISVSWPTQWNVTGAYSLAEIEVAAYPIAL